MRSLLLHGQSDWLTLLAWLLGPWLMGAWLAWVAASIRQSTVIVLLAASGLTVIGFIFYSQRYYSIYNSRDIYNVWLWIPVALAVVLPIRAYVNAMCDGLLRPQSLGIALVFMAMGAAGFTFYAGAVQFDGAMPWFGAGAAAMLVAPAAAVTLQLANVRHQ